MSVRWGSDEVADLLWKRLLRVMRRVNATAVQLHACDVRLLVEEYGLPKAAEIMLISWRKRCGSVGIWMKRADELRALAAEGATQVEAARRLGISRQRVHAVARDAGIAFQRATAKRRRRRKPKRDIGAAGTPDMRPVSARSAGPALPKAGRRRCQRCSRIRGNA